MVHRPPQRTIMSEAHPAPFCLRPQREVSSAAYPDAFAKPRLASVHHLFPCEGVRSTIGERMESRQSFDGEETARAEAIGAAGLLSHRCRHERGSQ